MIPANLQVKAGVHMNYLQTVLVFMAAMTSSALEHRFICVDNGANRLIHVDQQQPGRDWSVELPKGSRDLQLVGSDTILVSHGNGAGLYSLADGKSLKLITDRYKNINSARLLEGGGTLLVSRTGDVFQLDQSGKELRSFKIQCEDLDIRLARFNAAGNLVVVQTKQPRCVIEADMNGKVLRTLPLEGKGYRAQELKNGNLLISIGDSVKVIEIDPQGRVQRFVGGKAGHPDIGLDFFSGFDLLANGNIIVANWLGHGKQGTAAHLLEFDPDNNVVWKWEDHQTARQVTNVLVIDEVK
jgi:hypothetical protein